MQRKLLNHHKFGQFLSYKNISQGQFFFKDTKCLSSRQLSWLEVAVVLSSNERAGTTLKYVSNIVGIFLTFSRLAKFRSLYSNSF